MNALLRKELRLLRPAWVAALAAATLPLWLGEYYVGLALPCYWLAILFLGLSSFGQEMSCGTFGLLLSQPEKRERFWRIKAGLLALASLSAWGVFIGCCWMAGRQSLWRLVDPSSLAQNAAISGLLTLLAFAGGLWSTLLLRELATAFFGTVLVPLGIFGALILFLDVSEGRDEMIVYLVLQIYAVAGYFVARHLFLRAQDVAWTGGQISLTTRRGRPLRWLGFGFQEKRAPWLALIFKELQLQEVTMIIVPLLLLLHLAALAVRHFAPIWATRLGYLDGAAYLWLMAPFVVGCVAVAEERRYNTLESLLCLPARKRSQFLVKFLVVMTLGIALGAVVPWVLENVGGDSRQWIGLDWLIELVSTAAAIAAIAFFASTMARGMLQAFTVALLFSMLGWAALAFLPGRYGSAVVLYGGLLFPAFAWPAMLIAYFWLAFRNYKCLQTGWPLWAGNLIRLLAVFVAALVVAGAIYARAWEIVMPLEPRHGSARLSGTGQARIAEAWFDGEFYVLLPDGRLWAGQTDRTRPDRPPKHLSGHFVGGSNWVDVAGSRSEGAAALKSDGTLWRFSRRAGSGQIGSDSDWKKVVAGQSVFLALKQNGTIWGWGWDESGNLPVFSIANGGTNLNNRIPNPVQLWPDADWVDVFAAGLIRAVKRDGSIWTWGYDRPPVNGPITNRAVFNAVYHRLVRAGLEGTNWSSLAGDGWLTVGVRTDGTLWAGRLGEALGNPWVATSLFSSPIPIGKVLELGRIGAKSDWIGVSQGVFEYLALEADGTLWALNRNTFEPKQPSRYHDWLAASANHFEIWALAKDGTISCWGDVFALAPAAFRREPNYDDESHFFLLRPSRRPLVSINILDASF